MSSASPNPIKRLAQTISQLVPGSGDQNNARGASGSASGPQYITVSASGVQNPTHWNGWGYRDTAFEINPEGKVALTGTRYLFSGKTLDSLRPWMEEKTGVDIKNATPSQQPLQVPPPVLAHEFLDAIKGAYLRVETSDAERLFHAHGHTCQEIYNLRFGKFARVPDVVIYPGKHEDVEKIVAAANKFDVVIIPFGGGTSVTQALICPENEKRCIVSLDMHGMNKIKWINRKNMTACIETGIVGKELDAQLRGTGLVLGHEPDSLEFSTLGGWIATRASGMRKNKYGNIEDIIVQMRVVTSVGTIEKNVQVPRMSTGPDVHEFILGSEGTLGVVTEAIVRLRPAPEVTIYGSMIFPNFESGVQALYEIQLNHMAPVSIRLVDNNQFQFSQVLKPARDKKIEEIQDKIKKWYVVNRLKFNPNEMVAATLLFEGTKAEVAQQEKNVYAISAKYGGMKAGAENGIRGYFLTYMIAYLRDFAMNYSFIAESFETSVPWENVLPLVNNVKNKIITSAKALGVSKEPFVSARVTQLYDTGACVYFYFGFVWTGLKDPVATFNQIEHDARDEIIKYGGSLSHHHGIGKLRKHWMEQTVSNTGLVALNGLKKSLDPKNIFAAGNLIN